MKEFRTELIPARTTFPFGLKDKVFAIGSCFADAIGSQLTENKCPVWNNTFGTSYNPLSIHRLLQFGLECNFPSPGSYLENNGTHFNYDFHSSFSAVDKQQLAEKLEATIREANEFLKKTGRIIITYGTAFAFRRKNGEIVSNCHKLPSSEFTKSLLSEEDIIKSFETFHAHLIAINPTCRIILTVSPVRHLKDTLELNAVSKSTLRLACHAIAGRYANVEYFPAYELMLDDLRDYRFYKTDRLHPTDEAVDYIWEKFITAYLDDGTRQFISQWQEMLRDLAHRPFNPASPSHQLFLRAALAKLQKMKPVVDVSAEIQTLMSQITTNTAV